MANATSSSTNDASAGGPPVGDARRVSTGGCAARDPRGSLPKVPGAVEAIVGGVCILSYGGSPSCGCCWGPCDSRLERISIGDWQTILGRLASQGTKEVVFGGDGEPLPSNSLVHVLRRAREVGLCVTLSTKGSVLARRPELLAYVDTVLVSLDGHTPVVHESLRRAGRAFFAWDDAIKGIVLAQSRGAAVMVDTAVATRNIASVPKIPMVLEARGVELTRLSFRLHQMAPIGPQLSRAEWDSWAVSAPDLDGAAASLQEGAPECKVRVDGLFDLATRYLRVEPGARAFGIGLDSAGVPTAVAFGNILTHPEKVLGRYAEHGARLVASHAVRVEHHA